MDLVEEDVGIPSSIHGYLIGKNGIRVRDLETMHDVKISFSNDRVIVRGLKEMVSRAISEIHQVRRSTQKLTYTQIDCGRASKSTEDTLPNARWKSARDWLSG